MNFIHRIQAILVMNSCGVLLFGKYFCGPSTPAASKKLASPEAQRELEANIFEATKQAQSPNFDMVQVKNHNVVFVTKEDLIFHVVGDVDENPMVLFMALQTLTETLSEFQDLQILDARQLEDRYELLVLVVDELVDDGILLETSSMTIAECVEEVNISGNDIPVREALTQFNKILRDNL